MAKAQKKATRWFKNDETRWIVGIVVGTGVTVIIAIVGSALGVITVVTSQYNALSGQFDALNGNFIKHLSDDHGSQPVNLILQTHAPLLLDSEDSYALTSDNTVTSEDAEVDPPLFR